MNIKKMIGIVGLFGAGYGIGKIKGYVDITKVLLDMAEKEIPGSKRIFAEALSDYIINKMFEDEKNEKEES